MIKKILEYFRVFTVCLLFAFVAWLFTQDVPKTAPPVYETVKKAEGRSVLVKTEKLGDDVKPMIVRHWARYTETGTIDYWQEVVE